MALDLNNSKGELVNDPYKHKELYDRYKDSRLKAFSKKNRIIVEKYINDMEKGRNVNNGKGKRGYARLNTLLSRLKKISELLDDRNKTLTTVTADDLHNLFDDMRSGKIKKDNGRKYRSVQDYVKIFKAFWRWYGKHQRRENKKEVENITIDLDATMEKKPEFVYFTLSSLQLLTDYARFDYKVLMLFMFDTGMRVTELLNIKKKDISVDTQTGKMFVEIRSETSKTFGRKFKIMLCGDLLRKYLDKCKFKRNDFIFPFHAKVVNQYIKRLSRKVFGKKLGSLMENKSEKDLSLYDIRHSSACYWLPRYKNRSALMYKFGWKKETMIHYYTEFLGMRDTITEDDMLVGVEKTELEKQLETEKNKVETLQEQMAEILNRQEKFEKAMRLIKLAKKGKV